MAVDHDAIVALGRDPVRDDAPVGDPVRYDEAFEELQAQLDRIGSLSGEQPEWGQVVTLATDILKNKSKDLLVVTYLGLGLFEQDGYRGLRAGLCCYTEFLKTFWEGCFPKVKPPHGRYNAIQYLIDKLLVQIELKGGECKRMPGAGEKEAVHQCAEQFDSFVEALDAAFKDMPDSPNPLPLKRAFKALATKVGPLVSEQPAQPAAPPAQPGAAAPPAAATAAPAPAAAPLGAAVPDSFATPTAAVQAVIKVAKYLMAQNDKDPRPYALARAAHFGGVLQAPKDRLLPAPANPQRRQFFETAAGGGNFPELLTQAEGQFVVTPLWLDMQRFVATALKGMGPMYAAAHHIVVFETLALVSRLPDLLEVTFKDGAGFADGATKAWIGEMQSEFGGGGGGGSAAAGDALGEAVAEARKLLTESKQADALQRLTRAADGSSSRRQQFRAQLALAGFCADMNKPNLATPILEGLESIIAEYAVVQWEPELAAEVYQKQYECLKKALPKPTPDQQGRMNDVFAKLCRLNPAAALKLDGAK